MYIFFLPLIMLLSTKQNWKKTTITGDMIRRIIMCRMALIQLTLINREVTMMHFIDNHISRRFQRRTPVTLPSLGICSLPVNNVSTFPIHSDSMGIDSRRVSLPFIIDFYIEGIEFAKQVLIYCSCPGSIFF